MSKNILVASYYFPPYPGVGGRRMAKFCKYLAKKGYTIHVIKPEDHRKDISVWLNDINHPNIKLYSLPINYPRVLRMADDMQKKEKSLLHRISYKIVYHFYKTIQSKRVYDPTFLWEKQFVILAQELIKKNAITNFIVSVSPHYYAYYAVRIKEKFPELNLIIDFRDPWLSMVNYGMQNMNDRQKEKEIKMIKKVVTTADYLISPSMFALNEFKPYVNDEKKMIEITHAFDMDDIDKYIQWNNTRTAEEAGKTKFIYPGTLYQEIQPFMMKLNEVLNYLRKNKPTIYMKLEFEFYTDDLHYSSYFKDHSNVSFFKPLGKDIARKIIASDIIFIFYTEFSKNFRSTKFYEFLPFCKNYLYVGPKGDTYDFIEKYQLGNSFSEQDSIELWISYFEKVINNKHAYQPLIDYNDYSIEKQTDKLIDLFK